MQPPTAQTRPMLTIQESVQTCLRKYGDFSGRATRAEYWWWQLAALLAALALSAVDNAIMWWADVPFSPLQVIFSLAVLLPGLAVTCRRLHDIGKTGWWQLIWFLMVIAAAILVAIGAVFTWFSISGGSFFDPDYWDVSFNDFVPLLLTVILFVFTIVGVFIWQLVWLVQPGQDGPNAYGPDPRALTPAPEPGNPID